MCQALDEVIAEGRAETLLNAIRNLKSSMNFTAEQAMNALLVPLEDRANYLAKL